MLGYSARRNTVQVNKEASDVHSYWLQWQHIQAYTSQGLAEGKCFLLFNDHQDKLLVDVKFCLFGLQQQNYFFGAQGGKRPYNPRAAGGDEEQEVEYG